MTLLSQYLHIHFQFIFILFISSNFKLYLFLTTNEINLISNMEGRFLLFVFAPCATVWVPRYTHKVRSLQVLRRLRCSLFWHVAATFLSLPLKSAHFSSTSSLLFSQRAAAFRLSNIFIDPPACLMTFHIIFLHALSSKSCPHILPRFSFLKQVIWHRGVDRR